MRQLDNIKMSPGQDSDVFLTKIYELRDQLVYIGEPISDDGLTDIMMKGLTGEYDRIMYDTERDPDFSISDIEVTMRNMYSNRVARGILSKGVRGRDSAMTATSPLDSSATPTKFTGKCFSCGRPGHHSRDCRSKRQPNSRSRTVKWCTLHRTDKHDDSECNQIINDSAPTSSSRNNNYYKNNTHRRRNNTRNNNNNSGCSANNTINHPNQANTATMDPASSTSSTTLPSSDQAQDTSRPSSSTLTHARHQAA
ncbi:unnamed protein product [Sphacelaria rigidula]